MVAPWCPWRLPTAGRVMRAALRAPRAPLAKPPPPRTSSPRTGRRPAVVFGAVRCGARGRRHRRRGWGTRYAAARHADWRACVRAAAVCAARMAGDNAPAPRAYIGRGAHSPAPAHRQSRRAAALQQAWHARSPACAHLGAPAPARTHARTHAHCTTHQQRLGRQGPPPRGRCRAPARGRRVTALPEVAMRLPHRGRRAQRCHGRLRDGNSTPTPLMKRRCSL